MHPALLFSHPSGSAAPTLTGMNLWQQDVTAGPAKATPRAKLSAGSVPHSFLTHNTSSRTRSSIPLWSRRATTPHTSPRERRNISSTLVYTHQGFVLFVCSLNVNVYACNISVTNYEAGVSAPAHCLLVCLLSRLCLLPCRPYTVFRAV